MGWAARFLTAMSLLAAGSSSRPTRSSAAVPEAASQLRRSWHTCSPSPPPGAPHRALGHQSPSSASKSCLRHLPRHQFGSLQGKMFLAYFMLISVCSAISVAAFAYLHPWKAASTIERYQLGFLISALVFDLSNLLVSTPMTIEGGKMMMKRHKMETRSVSDEPEVRDDSLTGCRQ